MKEIQQYEECRVMCGDDDYGFWMFIEVCVDYLKFQDCLHRDEFLLVPKGLESDKIPAHPWKFYNVRLTS